MGPRGEKANNGWGCTERQFCRLSSLEAASETVYKAQGIFLKSALWKAGKLSRISQWKLSLDGSPVVIQKCLQVGHSSQPFLLLHPLMDSAAAAKSLQSCPTLCNPIDVSPPRSPIPGILQARTLEWVAISFSNA